MQRWIASALVVLSLLTTCSRKRTMAKWICCLLAADISRSVDEPKFKLQREGFANAIADPRVVRAMTAGPRARIALCFFECKSLRLTPHHRRRKTARECSTHDNQRVFRMC